ncbi:MAG: hypothetical protein ABUK11_00455 [Mariprofundaceae bacterium]
MDKLTFRQRLMNAFVRPRQIMLLDSQSGKPARNIKVSFMSIVLIFLGIIAAIFFMGTQSVSTNSTQSLIPQHVQLQRQYDQLHSGLAEANALNDLKERQLESLKQELFAQQEHNSELSNRLRMFESILEARKATGVKLLNAEATWIGKDSIHYNLTLVKGGSYPRRISGSISLTAISPEAEIIEISLGKQKSRLPFRIETHTFLRGSADWEYDWHPDKLLAVVFDRKGKELLQMEIAVKGVPQ